MVLPPLLAGSGVGVVVSAAARLIGTSSCGTAAAPSLPDLGGDCAALVASMAHRVGVATGLATALIALVGAGLARTAARVDEDRRLRTVERAPSGGGE